MRMSVDKNDPGYNPQAHWYDVTLNGQRLKGVVTADEEQGHVFVREAPINGSQEYTLTRREGKVKIISRRKTACGKCKEQKQSLSA